MEGFRNVWSFEEKGFSGEREERKKSEKEIRNRKKDDRGRWNGDFWRRKKIGRKKGDEVKEWDFRRWKWRNKWGGCRGGRGEEGGDWI